MKLPQLHYSLAFNIVFFSAFFAPTTTIAAEMPAMVIAKVTAILGDAWTSTNTGQKQKLSNQSLVNENAVITTGEHSMVTIKFNDQSEIKVSANSEFKVNTSSKEADHLDLILNKGIIKSMVQKHIDHHQWFNIHTHAATMGVRGTEFITSVTPSSNDEFHEEVYVLKGSVQVSDTKGRPLSLVQPGMTLGFHSIKGVRETVIKETSFKAEPIPQDKAELLKSENYLSSPEKLNPPEAHHVKPAPEIKTNTAKAKPIKKAKH